jgi:hypothetical protein
MVGQLKMVRAMMLEDGGMVGHGRIGCQEMVEDGRMAEGGRMVDDGKRCVGWQKNGRMVDRVAL